jgi:hypothetical protein
MAEPGHFVFQHSRHGALLYCFAALRQQAGRPPCMLRKTRWRFVPVV